MAKHSLFTVFSTQPMKYQFYDYTLMAEGKDSGTTLMELQVNLHFGMLIWGCNQKIKIIAICKDILIHVQLVIKTL